jgi:hypothetical protein
MSTAFFLTKLKKGVKAEDYERWVREFDYPGAKRRKSIKSYKVHRINGAFRGDKVYDYIEVVEITDLDEYRKGFDSAAGKKLHEEWSRYIGESVAVHGEAI